MSVEIEIPKDHRLVTRVSYGAPAHFHSCQGVYPTGRRRWQFWLPKMLYVYCTVEPMAATFDGEPITDETGRVVAYKDANGNIGWVIQ